MVDGLGAGVFIPVRLFVFMGNGTVAIRWWLVLVRLLGGIDQDGRFVEIGAWQADV